MNSSILEWNDTDEVVSQVVSQLFSSGSVSLTVAISHYSKVSSIMLPQLWLEVALVILWSIHVDIIGVREVLPHQVV